MVSEIVTLEGHIIDSDMLRRVFDRVVEDGGAFEVLEIRIGRTNAETSHARLSISADDHARLDALLEHLSYLGASSERADARFAPAEADGILPDEFYSTTNFATSLRIDGRWREAHGQKCGHRSDR